MDETLNWYLILKTACGAMRTIPHKCVIPPKEYVIPLRFRDKNPFREDEVPRVTTTPIRKFELVRLDHSNKFHIAHYEEM